MSTDARITRRRLIGTAAAGAAAAALPVTPVSARSRRKADVVIVGAGLAGLTAARDLAKHHRSVIVLEARDRVGGRTLNHPLGDGQAVEVGGEFVGPTQDRVLALARSLGVGTFKAYNEGQDVVIARGRRSLYPAVPGLPDDSQDQQLFDDIVAALNDIDKQSAKVG